MFNRNVWVIGLLLMTRPGLCQDREVRGLVFDDRGKPLEGAYINSIQHVPTYRKVHTQTDGNGGFELASAGRIVFVLARGFKPRTIVRDQEQSFLRIALSPTTAKRMPQCQPGERAGRRYGSMVQFLVPAKFRIRKSQHDPDNWKVLVSAPKSDPKEQLVIWTLAGGGDGFVPEEWLLQASQFDQTDSFALNWKGKNREGRNWRWFSSPMDIVHYYGVSDGTASFFDEIIDSACENEVPRDKGSTTR